MAKEKVKMPIEIIGSIEHVSVICHMLKMIEHLGAVGSSRSIRLWVDGDGGAQVQIAFPGAHVVPEIDDKESDPEVIKFYLD